MNESILDVASDATAVNPTKKTADAIRRYAGNAKVDRLAMDMTATFGHFPARGSQRSVFLSATECREDIDSTGRKMASRA